MDPVTMARDSAAMRINPNGVVMRHRKTIRQLTDFWTRGQQRTYNLLLCPSPQQALHVVPIWKPEKFLVPEELPDVTKRMYKHMSRWEEYKERKAHLRELRRWLGTDHASDLGSC